MIGWTPVATYSWTAFGQPTSTPTIFHPWAYSGHRLDPELGLVYFGKRYYDPSLARWLTTDPAWFTDSTNLYQYLWSNPFRYQDPYGENLFGYLCGLAEILLGGAGLATLGTEAIIVGGFAICSPIGLAVGLVALGCVTAVAHSQDRCY